MSSHYKSILLRRGSLSELNASNPVLASGEAAFAVDASVLKIGNGESSWNNLDRFINTQDIKYGLVNVNIPSIDINQSHVLSVNFPGIDTQEKYAVYVSPQQALPSGLVVAYSYVSSNNTIAINIRNTSIDVIDGGNVDNSGSPGSSSTPINVDFGIFCYLVQGTTTTTTTTTTQEPVTDSVFSFGYNEFGQLGTSNNQEYLEPHIIAGNNTWKLLTAGYYHSLGIDINDDLYAFGYNYYGQLGNGNSGASKNKNIATKITDSYIQNNLFNNQSKWNKVSAGAYHSLAIDSHGHLFSFGSNAYGSLGLGDMISRSRPTMIGDNINYITLASGEVYNLLDNSGEYIISGVSNGYTGPIRYILGNGNFTFSNIESGAAIAILNNGKQNLVSYSGESFAGSSILTGTTADGTYNFYYGTVSGNVTGNYDKLSLYTISSGYMGGENIFSYGDPNTGWTDVAAGTHHSLALKNGKLYSFGHNTFGQLGLSDNSHKTIPSQVGNRTDWEKIYAGNYHSIAIDNSGNMWSFGLNAHGQLGLGNVINKNVPTKISGVWQAFEDFNFYNLSTSGPIGFDEDKIVLNYTPNKQYNYQERFLLSNGSYAISGIPSGYALAVLNNNKQNYISYSGTNYLGSKTLLNTTNDGTYNFYYGTINLHVSGDFENVSLHTYYNGEAGGENILFYNRAPSGWTHASVGNDYTIALDTHGKLWSFGKNDHGQLGLGDDISRRLPARINFNNCEKFDTGANHTLLVNTNKQLWSFGQNNNGQLGLGDKTDRYEPTEIYTDIRWGQPVAGGNHSLVKVFAYYPSSPSSITVKNGSQNSLAGTGELEVSWTHSTSDEEGITNYVLQYSSNGSSQWFTVEKPISNQKIFVVPDLVNGTNYIFRVAAVNYIGQGAFSVNSLAVAPSETIDADYCDVLLLAHLDGANNSTNIVDYSKYNWSSSLEGSAKLATLYKKFGKSSAIFDGIGGITFGSGIDMNLSGNFTIECFFRPVSYAYVNPQAVIHGNKLLSLDNAENGWGIYCDHGIISISHKIAGATSELLRSINPLALNAWHHIAWVRNNNTNSLYINGQKASADSILTASIYHDTAIDLGTRISTGSVDHRNLYGYLDEVRISKLSRYSGSNYTVPIRSFGVNTCS